MKEKLVLEHSPELAEIIGIMMGDGCIYLDKKGKYQTSIACHKQEIQYQHYLKELFENHFNYKFGIIELHTEVLVRNISKAVGTYLIEAGLKSGNKVKNKITPPNWIKEKKIYMMRFLRGFFDTDGCVYRKFGQYAQIQVKTACEETTNSIKDAMLFLGFRPTRVQKEVNTVKGKICHSWKVYLIRQNEIKRFFEEIKPMNRKHIRRYIKIKGGATGI